MKLDQLQHRVARAEAVLEGRREQVRTHWTTLRQGWHEGWTPLRIVVVGLGTGFLVGRAEPVAALGKLGGKIGGTRWLQMLSTLYKLFNVVTAKTSSDAAERTADTTQAAADTEPADASGTTRHSDAPAAHGPDAPNPTDTTAALSEP
ncbi:hypothetical protein [Xanthomonas sp. MUS 060]|uniref:hypothetical protein n=1 Tax=Xanthomonas sp. MUS 060 TaxID=1588031 RepID=UPI0005F2BA53|nr:hypothetical protein [Xanthomonas sp. MUS 060]